MLPRHRRAFNGLNFPRSRRHPPASGGPSPRGRAQTAGKARTSSPSCVGMLRRTRPLPTRSDEPRAASPNGRVADATWTLRGRCVGDEGASKHRLRAQGKHVKTSFYCSVCSTAQGRGTTTNPIFYWLSCSGARAVPFRAQHPSVAHPCSRPPLEVPYCMDKKATTVGGCSRWCFTEHKTHGEPDKQQWKKQRRA